MSTLHQLLMSSLGDLHHLFESVPPGFVEKKPENLRSDRCAFGGDAALATALARKASSESSMKSRKMGGGVFSAFRSSPKKK